MYTVIHLPMSSLLSDTLMSETGQSSDEGKKLHLPGRSEGKPQEKLCKDGKAVQCCAVLFSGVHRALMTVPGHSVKSRLRSLSSFL
jgi:hypothetical protein